MQPYFDAFTGQLVNVGSPAGFLVFVLLVVVGVFAAKKFFPEKFDSAVAQAKAEVAEIEARMKSSGPEALARMKADLEVAKAKLKALVE